MPINFACPHCGHRTEVADQFAGQSGPCARCGQTVSIPAAGGAGAAPAGAKPAAQGGSGVGLVLGIVGGIFVALLLCGGIVGGVLFSVVGTAREAARRSQCQNNMRQIAMAMQLYENIHGTMPPAYVADEFGRPMHSWRVLILPYLEGQYVYDQYDLTQPWDSPANLRLQSMMPSVYACPSSSNSAGTGMTHYQVITGPQTAFNGSQAASLISLSSQDGTANTFLFVEAQTPVNWLEPTDLSFDAMSFQVNDPAGTGLGSEHGDGASAAMCDGSVHFVADDTPTTTVQGMATASGGESVYLGY
jgi:prepilin-type processing-associated H-X9-DG protein